jgi:hypothetical protein
VFDCFLVLVLLIFTSTTYLKSFNWLVANNKQAAAFVSSNLNLGSIVDAMHQTTLMQCFSPPHLGGPVTLPDGYRTIVTNGMKYLLKNTTNHLMIVLTVAESAAAQSIRPIDANRQEGTKNKRKKRESSSSIVLAKHKHSDSSSASNNSSIIYVCAKKKKKTRMNKTRRPSS